MEDIISAPISVLFISNEKNVKIYSDFISNIKEFNFEFVISSDNLPQNLNYDVVIIDAEYLDNYLDSLVSLLEKFESKPIVVIGKNSKQCLEEKYLSLGVDDLLIYGTFSQKDFIRIIKKVIYRTNPNSEIKKYFCGKCLVKENTYIKETINILDNLILNLKHYSI